MDSGIRTVLMTAPDRESGESLATDLVRERLAACANVIGGVTSVYWWGNELERTQEVLVILKTSEARVDELVERAASLHPYDVPELIVLNVETGYRPYLDWVRSETTGGEIGSKGESEHG